MVESSTRDAPPGRPPVLRWLLPFVAVLIFFGVALSVRLVWNAQGWYQATGDEPHYLVAARSLGHFHSLEMTDAYREEFTRALYYPPRFHAPPGSVPYIGSGAHVEHGAHGYFLKHGLGLPALLALPNEWFGPSGARIAMILFGCGAVLVAWFATGLFLSNPWTRFLTTVVTTAALPFLTAANQIYPDLPAGVICAFAVLVCTLLVYRGPTRGTANGVAAAGVLLGLLPWLHNRFFATGLVLLIGLGWFVARAGRLTRALIAWLVAPYLLSVLLWIAYWAYAFGSSPLADTGRQLEISTTSAMVLVGLHLDRLQGIFVQNPLLILGFVGIVLFAARSKALALVVGVTYASLVVPTAMQQIWYGGQTFGGRFAWAGAAVLLVPTMLALARLRERARWLFVTVCTLVPLLELWYLWKPTFGDFDMYNHVASTPLARYPSWIPGPALYDSRWAYGWVGNWVALIGLVAVVVGLCVWLWPNPSWPEVRSGPRRAPVPESVGSIADGGSGNARGERTDV